MTRFEPETLSSEDRAFLESIEGLHQRIETLKLLFPDGRRREALNALQSVASFLCAAAICTPLLAPSDCLPPESRDHLH